MYGFNSGHGPKAMVANRKLAEELKREKGFIYEVYFHSFYKYFLMIVTCLDNLC